MLLVLVLFWFFYHESEEFWEVVLAEDFQRVIQEMCCLEVINVELLQLHFLEKEIQRPVSEFLREFHANQRSCDVVPALNVADFLDALR